MKTILLFAGISLFIFIESMAQAPKPAVGQHFAIPKSGEIAPRNVTTDYFPLLQNLEAPKPGGDDYWGFILEQKKKVSEKWPQKESDSPLTPADSTAMPVPGDQFNANLTIEGVPNDNDLAISNSGFLISAINSNLYMYDVNADTVIQVVSLDAFSSSLGLTESKFDPKLLFDPKEEKFILVFLSGFTDSTNNIIVAFSESDDPGGLWNLYALPGNPLNDTMWSDYPMIAMTDQELIVTVNLIGTGQPWETGFSQSLVWQINKDDGYAGDSLSTKLWTGINYAGKSLRNLTPMRGGSDTYGPNLYFISNRNFDLANDSIWVLELTDTIGASGAAISVDVRKSNAEYGMPPLAQQKFNHFFATNDARALNGFFENDMLQFAGNSVDTSTGRAAVYHGIVSNVSTTKIVTGKILGEANLDYGYPNLSYTGNSISDVDAIITFNQSSKTSNAGMSTIYYTPAGDYSPRLTLRTGDNFVNILQGAIERWGDYSGSQRKFDQPGTVWASAAYGKQNSDFGTWVAELTAPLPVGDEEYLSSVPKMKVFPNPVSETTNIEFEIQEPALIRIDLTDASGRLIRTFFQDIAKAGSNRFSFCTGPLADGLYFLNVETAGKILMSQRVVVFGN